MIKVAIYSPYLQMMGGGERYILSIASILSQKYEVYLYAGEDIGEKANSMLGINLDRVHFLPANLLHRQNVFERFINLRQYGLFFYMTDGSVFFSGAGKNCLIIQSPLHIPKKSFLNWVKLSNWQIICYSNFIKSAIQGKLGDKIKLSTLAPCINIKSGTKQKKENIILSVGRFFPYPHDKKHAVLIDLFKKNFKKYFSNWKLVIAGGLTEAGGKKMFEDLKKKSAGFPIEVVANLSSNQLTKLYQKSKLYWHAAGFGEDLAKYPEKAEHFGIAPIEAMAAGTIPLVYNGGGLKDTINDGEGGYLWNNLDELVQKSVNLINNEELLSQQQIKAYEKSADYSRDKFYEKLDKIIEG